MMMMMMVSGANHTTSERRVQVFCGWGVITLLYDIYDERSSIQQYSSIHRE